MGSTICCTSRDPPSPVGISPRSVTVIPSSTGPVLPKSPPLMASWSTQFSKPEDSAELRAIFEDNVSDHDDDRGTMRSTKSKMSSKKLNAVASAVTSRLRKHFSKESTLSKRLSRSSVGNSEEEIERRKELRRLRDKRIQDELSMDNFDDDAVSLSTVASSNMLSQGIQTIPPRTQGEVTSTSLDQGPTPKNTSEIPLTVALSQGELKASSEDVLAVQRQPCSVPVCQPGYIAGAVNIPSSLPMDSFYSTMPSSPVLRPQRLPSITDAAIRRTSWRLSFASEERSCQLRAPSLDEKSHVETSKPALTPPRSPALIWLRSQGLRLSSQAISDPSEHTGELGILPSHNSLRRSTSDFGGVDGSFEVEETPIHLWDMQIPQRLRSRELYSYGSSPQLSSWGSHNYCREHSVEMEKSKFSMANRSRHRKTSSSGDVDTVTSRTWAKVTCEKKSSVCSLRNESKVATANSSRLYLSCHLGCGEDTPVQDTESQAPEATLMPLDSTAIIASVMPNDPKGKLIVPSSIDQHITFYSSPVASETESFRQRKDELESIETRFPASIPKGDVVSSVSSKFKEEFDVSPPSSQVKSSIFSVLHLSRKAKTKLEFPPKSFDGAVSVDGERRPRSQGYGYFFADRSPSLMTTRRYTKSVQVERMQTSQDGRVSPLHVPSESATAMWLRIISRTQKEHSDNISANLRLPKPKHAQETKKGLGSFISLKEISDKMKDKQRPKSEDVKGTKRHVATIDAGVVTDMSVHPDQEFNNGPETYKPWASNLQLQDKTALSNTVATTKSKYIPQTTTQDSWFRYPSHTRPGRSGPAGISDKVYSIDFADNIGAGTEQLTSGQGDDGKAHSRSIPFRISKKIRSVWHRVVTGKMTSMNDSITAHGRRSSTNVGGTLEFPELEILPLENGLKGLKEVEADVAESIRRDERIQRMAHNYDGSGSGGDEGTKIHEEASANTGISISNPIFYADCVLHFQAEDVHEDVKSTLSQDTFLDFPPTRQCSLDKDTFKREKFKTWSGRDRSSRHFMGSLNMRRSTLDLTIELEKLERFERERVVKLAKDAWGGYP